MMELTKKMNTKYTQDNHNKKVIELYPEKYAKECADKIQAINYLVEEKIISEKEGFKLKKRLVTE